MEENAGAVPSAFHCSDGNFKQPGDVLLGKSLIPDEIEDFALVSRKQFSGFVKRSPGLECLRSFSGRAGMFGG